jgi:AcrR family transcriptional regulator
MAPSAPARRRLDPDARRRQLIELGLRMLSREPREQVAIDRIAQEAGISRGLLFHYFPTKRDFHVAVVSAAAERLVEVVTPDPSLPAPERLARSLEAYVDYVIENRDLYVSLVRGAAGADEELQRVFDRTRGAIAERIVASLETHAGTHGPLLRTALRGWLALVEETTLDSLRHGDVSRAELVGLQRECLRGLLDAVDLGRDPAQRG